MVETFKTLIANQFEAALCTLNACIDACPESGWNASVAKYPFCQVVFHVLFFADYYLGENEESIREQAFHHDHREVFADYEELAPREPVALHEKSWIKQYLQHCRAKAKEVIAAENSDTLQARCGFGRPFSRAELYVYNIRHLQHHAAQLSLRLRLDCGQDIPWFGSGWLEFQL